MTDAFSDLKGIIRKSGMSYALIAHQTVAVKARAARTMAEWLRQ